MGLRSGIFRVDLRSGSVVVTSYFGFAIFWIFGFLWFGVLMLLLWDLSYYGASFDALN